MQSGQLQYYLHDDFDAFRFELAGSLSGAAVESIYQAWRTALSVITNRSVIVDITFVKQADEQGRSLLRLWRRKGARIVARSPESRALAAAVGGEPIPDTPAVSKRDSRWYAIGSLFRPAAFARISAEADKPTAGGDDHEPINGHSKEFSRSLPVEIRVP